MKSHFQSSAFILLASLVITFVLISVKAVSATDLKPKAITAPLSPGLDFLRAEQLRLDQRNAVVFVANTEAGSFVDFATFAYIRPWLATSYDRVVYLNEVKDLEKTWQDLASKYNTIDYFSAVHQDQQFKYIPPPEKIRLRPGQLRLVYTTACKSWSSEEFIGAYSAGLTIGHAAISASPLIVFRVIRNWSYGATLSDAVLRSWAAGSADVAEMAGLLRLFMGEHWKSNEEVVRSTEPRIAYTAELPPHKARQSEVAVLQRNHESLVKIHTIRADDLIEQKKKDCQTATRWKTAQNSRCEKDWWPNCDRETYWLSCVVVQR